MTATLGHWLELLLALLTFGACVTAISLVVLGALRQGWRAPLPRRRFLPLLWVLGFCFMGSFSAPYAYLALTIALGFLVVDFPIRWVLIPLGWVHATYWISRLAGHSESPPDPRLRPLLLAARALGRRSNQAAQRFLERRLMQCGEQGPLGAAVAAILAHSRGDVAGAEAILRGVASVTDAEQNRLLWPVLRDFLYQDKSPSVPLDGEPSAGVWPSLSALAALARRLPGQACAEDVASAVAWLDELRGSSDWTSQLEARGANLCGAIDAGVVARAQWLAQAESDLAEAAREERWPATWLGSGATAEAVRALVREQRLATAERLARELQRRTNEAQSLPEPQEWQAWGELLRVSQEIEQDATTLADRQLLFRALHRPIWTYGYHQAFELGRRNLGSLVFLRQRRLAYAAEAAETYQVIEGNIRAARAQANGAKHEDSAIWYCHPHFVAAWRRLNITTLRLWHSGLALASCAGFAVYGLGRGTLFVAFLLTVLQLRSLRQPVLVEVLGHHGRIWIQTPTFRWSVAPGELELKSSFWRFSRVCLTKSPWWLPELLFTLHDSRADAERVRHALQELSGVAGSRARG